MIHRLCIAFAVVGMFVAVQAPLRGQADPDFITKKKTIELIEKAKEEYRIFFKKPNTTFEYWSAIKFEMDLGKFDLAAYHLKGLLEKPADDVDKDLIKLEQAEGMSAFLRLTRVRQWSEHPPFQKEAAANVDLLIDRVTKAVEKHLSDPDRIKKYMKQLVAPSEEERAFAYDQLARSRERAVPYLVEGLRVEYGKPLFVRFREMLLRMGPETVPVYLEVFKPANEKDARDLELRLTLLEIIERRDDPRVVPYLWHLSSAKQYPEAIRKRAKEVLASLLRLDPRDVPSAKETLTAMAERYYQHKMPFPEGKAVQIYPWDGETIGLKPIELTPSQAEEFFGMRYARQALDIDASYQPAQIVMLSLMLERLFRSDVDQILVQPTPPKMKELLTTIDAELVLNAMERGMQDRQIPVVLPLMKALGDRGEFQAARVTNGSPRGVVRGLYYPDRRVQFAALIAMLQMPSSTRPAAASDRMVDLMRRFLAAGPAPKALVAFAPMGKEVAVRETVKEMGFEPVLARQAREAIEKGKFSADFDLVVLHHGMPPQDFATIYGQLRADADLGGLPMLVIVTRDREKAVRKFTARDAGVTVLVEEKLQANDEMKDLLEKQIKSTQFAKLSPAERKTFAKVSMDLLWRIGRGEIEGYDVAPALDVILDQLQSPENSLLAMEILGRLPRKEIQYRLAAIAVDPTRGKLRLPAVFELNRHLQKNGMHLDRKQVAELKIAHKEAVEPELREYLTVTMSIVSRATPKQTGKDLLNFRPDVPAPPKEKEEKKDN